MKHGAATAPAALAEPERNVRAGWITLLFLANLGLWLAFYAPIQVLLPQQSARLDPGDKALGLSVVMGVGAVVALVANPVIGAFSDRTTSRWGRRHPWTLCGAAVGAVGLIVLAFAPNFAVMILGWCLTQAGLNGTLATLTAALPDRVPRSQRGRLGGLTGISQMLGTVLGTLVVTVVVTGLVAGYAACALLLLAGALAFTLCTPDDPLPKRSRPNESVLRMLRGMWISPRAHPDFGWGWLMHFLVNLGNALGTLYLLYFLGDAVGYPSPEDGLLVLMVLYGIALAIGGVVCGAASDRSGRRKPFILGSAVIMALAAALLVVWPNWPAALAAAPLLGAGFGTYWAAAPAVLTQVLPAASDRAKDLGLVNIANSLPQVVGPVIAGAVLATVHSYPALFALSALATLAGGAAVSRVRALR